MEQYDPLYRILAVVYVETNLNEKLVREGYAEVMYIQPSEFDLWMQMGKFIRTGYLQ